MLLCPIALDKSASRRAGGRQIVFRTLILKLNEWRVRVHRPRTSAEHVLLLVPHCLQRSTCERNIIHDVNRCARCGRCDVGDLLKLRDEFGIHCSLASGGREALAAARDAKIRVVVAVACEKELAEGILAAFPKPVVAVPNTRPNGPCKDTRVDAERVAATIRSVLQPAA